MTLDYVTQGSIQFSYTVGYVLLSNSKCHGLVRALGTRLLGKDTFQAEELLLFFLKLADFVNVMH